MKKLILITLVLSLNIRCSAQGTSAKTVSKNEMKVSWYYKNDSIFFEMSAPTDGWVTIGFNDSSEITGTYLIMGNVINGKPNVVEHYTLSPGNYKSLSDLGEKPHVGNIMGDENSGITTLKFSLPITPKSKYHRDLTEGNAYTMTIAYSLEDDFQHHSVMRTSINVKL